jgi:hypothetical protein
MERKSTRVSFKYDLTGKKFNMLLVVCKHGHIGKKVSWKCVCDCGAESIVVTNSLTSGNTKSCGCLNIKRAKELNLSHGMCKTRFYQIWCGLKNRCYKPNNVHYHLYGGRGIRLCERWHNFINFYDDMFETYQDGLSIDRVDTNGDYSPENCRWADVITQANNTRTNRIETVNGITDTVANLCRIFNMKTSTVNMRLFRGWSIEDAILKPIK